MFSFSLISFSGLSSSHRDLASQVSRSKTRTKTNPAKTSELNPKLQIFEGLFLMIQGPFLMNFLYLLPAASEEHPLQKVIQGPRRVFFFAAGARAQLLTRCLQPGAPTAKKHPQQKQSAAHPQQKNAPCTCSKKAPTTKIEHSYLSI